MTCIEALKKWGFLELLWVMRMDPTSFGPSLPCAIIVPSSVCLPVTTPTPAAHQNFPPSPHLHPPSTVTFHRPPQLDLYCVGQGHRRGLPLSPSNPPRCSHPHHTQKEGSLRGSGPRSSHECFGSCSLQPTPRPASNILFSKSLFLHPFVHSFNISASFSSSGLSPQPAHLLRCALSYCPVSHLPFTATLLKGSFTFPPSSPPHSPPLLHSGFCLHLNHSCQSHQ